MSPWTRAVPALALAAGLAAPLSSPARASVVIEGTFTARAECPAYHSFNAGSNPGAVILAPGTVYGAFELNRPDGPWVRLRVPGANPQERWVARECGRLTVYQSDAATTPETEGGGAIVASPLPAPMDTADASVDAPAPTAPADPLPDAGTIDPLAPVDEATLLSRSSRAFPWFFDRVDDGPDDPTPPPPQLGQVDQAVLKLCGGWGDDVPAYTFSEFLEERPSLRSGLLAQLGADEDTLVTAWFAENGFRHIFCGEPEIKDDDRWVLGGMHYMGRYAQAQLNGWAGRLEGGCSIVETAPPIYTSGVQFLAPDGSTGIKCINGYAKGLTASDMLFEVTKAYREARGTMGVEASACRHRVLDDGNAYEAVLVMRANAIVTFYPDATPDETLPYCGE
ncbi:EndoU domain-containing protein [Roseospira marina]|nr:EndoU domain-containing protein [Roseospira marina]MBB4312905.1 hypothetical protein [Roseospira marina]MBB5086322.1 hypothetical protein [Roseospira marina]